MRARPLAPWDDEETPPDPLELTEAPLTVELPDEPEWLGDILGPNGEVLTSVYEEPNPIGFAVPRRTEP